MAQIQSGQELIYRGRYGAAQVFFSDLTQQFPADPVGPVLEASALIWWGESRLEPTFQVDAVDSLLALAIGRAQLMADSARDDGVRFNGVFWLGIAYGYRARQADVRGNVWRAARDAKAMQGSLERAVAIDSTCVDCLLGLGAYDYALARASAIARLTARIIGLGGGDAERGLAWQRRAAEDGLLLRIEARWVYATSLLREGERDAATREEALRRLGDLSGQFPENLVFRRALGAPLPQP